MDRGEIFERALPLVPGRTALLVVDMQRGFVEPGEAMEVPPARDVVPPIRDLLGAFRDRGLAVVFTEFTYAPAAPLLVGDLHPEHRPGRPGAPTGFGLPSGSLSCHTWPAPALSTTVHPAGGKVLLPSKFSVRAVSSL